MRIPPAIILVLQAAYGLVLLATREPMGRRRLGRAVKRGSTQVPLRALGMRETGIHVGGWHVPVCSPPLRPRLLASLDGELADVAVTLAAGDDLACGTASTTLVVGGGSAALTATLLLAPVSRPTPRHRHAD